MSDALLRLYVTASTFISDRYNGRKDRGATAVEYGLLVGLIAVAIIAVLIGIGPKLTTLFTNVDNGLASATAKP
jgi:pilus assembly protein Flp/PilA